MLYSCGVGLVGCAYEIGFISRRGSQKEMENRDAPTSP